MLRALRMIGVEEDLCQLIADIYSNLQTFLLTAEGISDLVDIICGVKQGCALSAILFLLAIDPIITMILRGRDGCHILSYADDMGVIEDTKEEMNRSIEVLVNAASRIGLTINAKKCFSVHIASDHRSSLPTEFEISGQRINILGKFDATKYLGKPFGFYVLPDSHKIEDFIAIGKDILTSSLAPWQKLDAMKTFIFPSFQFSMRMSMFQKSHWTKLDEELKPLIKKVLNLPTDANTDYVYGETAKGLFGIPKTFEDSDIAKLDTAFKLLTSPDPLVLQTAWSDLKRAARSRTELVPRDADIADFLSGHTLIFPPPMDLVCGQPPGMPQRTLMSLGVLPVKHLLCILGKKLLQIGDWYLRQSGPT